MRGHSEFLWVDGLWTHAWVRGAGRPIVIVPGLACASWMYRRLAHELAAERQVFVYDPPGHGYSRGTWDFPTNITDLTDHLARWLNAAGLQKVPVFGHSLGGEVALDLAARYPKLVGALIACAPTGVPENPSVPEQLLRLLMDIPRERLGLLPSGFAAYSTAGFRRMYLLAHSQAAHDTGTLLPRIGVPTLLLDGDRDPVIHSWTVEAIERNIPDAVVRTIPGGTHALTDSHPKAVARLTLDFLQLVEVQRARDWSDRLPED